MVNIKKSRLREYFLRKSGLAEIPLLLGLMFMAIAVPLITKLTQQNLDTRNRAGYNCSDPGAVAPCSTLVCCDGRAGVPTAPGSPVCQCPSTPIPTITPIWPIPTTIVFPTSTPANRCFCVTSSCDPASSCWMGTSGPFLCPNACGPTKTPTPGACRSIGNYTCAGTCASGGSCIADTISTCKCSTCLPANTTCTLGATDPCCLPNVCRQFGDTDLWTCQTALSPTKTPTPTPGACRSVGNYTCAGTCASGSCIADTISTCKCAVAPTATKTPTPANRCFCVTSSCDPASSCWMGTSGPFLCPNACGPTKTPTPGACRSIGNYTCAGTCASGGSCIADTISTCKCAVAPTATPANRCFCVTSSCDPASSCWMGTSGPFLCPNSCAPTATPTPANRCYCAISSCDPASSCWMGTSGPFLCPNACAPTKTPTRTLTPTRTPTPGVVVPSATPTNGTGIPSLTPTSGSVNPTNTPTSSPSSCKQCPSDFGCYRYVNGTATEYRWFVSGYVATNYNKVADQDCVNNSVVKPSFKGKENGDANCDGLINGSDYSIWRREYIDISGRNPVLSNTWEADFTGPAGRCEGFVDGYDYSLWRRQYYYFLGQ